MIDTNVYIRTYQELPFELSPFLASHLVRYLCFSNLSLTPAAKYKSLFSLHLSSIKAEKKRLTKLAALAVLSSGTEASDTLL